MGLIQKFHPSGYFRKPDFFIQQSTQPLHEKVILLIQLLLGCHNAIFFSLMHFRYEHARKQTMKMLVLRKQIGMTENSNETVWSKIISLLMSHNYPVKTRVFTVRP